MVDRAPPESPLLLPLAGFVRGGLAALAAAALLALAFLPGSLPPRSGDHFVSKVLSARAFDDHMSVSSFAAPDGRGVVIWLEGVPSIPPGETVR
jgi:hypothetical protein